MKIKFAHVLICLSLLIVSCSEEIIECNDCPTVTSFSTDKNYFPLLEGSNWVYFNEYRYSDGTTYNSTDTIRVDSLYTLGNSIYRSVTMNSFMFMLVRKEGSKYFQRMASCGWGPEDYFLNDLSNPGEKLVTTGEFYTKTILVKKIHALMSIENVPFTNVMELQEQYGDDTTVTSYFANNVGLIFKKIENRHGYYQTTLKSFKIN